MADHEAPGQTLTVGVPTPFRIKIPQERVDEMYRRLRATAWPAGFPRDTWSYGVAADWLEARVAYWTNDFDWHIAQDELNKFSHYRVEIDGVALHFVHARGRGLRPLPIILTHGWPWTFWDWAQATTLLQETSGESDDWDCFDVVVPSLPGVALSEPPNTDGIGVTRIAHLWTALMRDVLGYKQFAACGGDWGALVTAQLARQGAPGLLGAFLLTATYPGLVRAVIPDTAWTADEAWMRTRMAASQTKIVSHVAVGRHAAQTLAFALADSPVGAAAWLWGPRHDWTCGEGQDPAVVFGEDFLCTTASLYWLTGTVGSSMRIYADNPPAPLDREWDMTVPTGVAVSPRDVVFTPQSVMSEQFDLRRWTVLPTGGHFAAAENPEAVSRELRSFFNSLGRASL